MLVLLVLPLAGTASARAQESVAVEAQRHEGFGRIIITFPDRMRLPEYEIINENGVLAILFATPLKGAARDRGGAGRYRIGGPVRPDMTGIRMGLRGPMQINTIDAGEQLSSIFAQ